MDMRSREQYLERSARSTGKPVGNRKTRLLNEARKRTRLNRKVLIRKLAHPPQVKQNKRRPRTSYGADVVTALIQVWEVFDYPCGQRLVAVLRVKVERLRSQRALRCSATVAEKLGRISEKTVDRLLARERQVRQLRRHRTPAVHPLLYQRIPVKVAADWETSEVDIARVLV